MAVPRSLAPGRGLIIPWVPAGTVMAVIFYVSSLPGKRLPSLFPYEDIFYHTLIYAMLAYFFSRALRATCVKLDLTKVLFISILFSILYGVSDEFHQVYVPYRSASGFDLVADAVGSLCGAILQRLSR